MIAVPGWVVYFEAIGGIVPDAALLLDPEGRIQAANARARQLLGPRGSIGSALCDACDEPARLAEYLRHCVRSSEPLPGSFVIPHASNVGRYRCKGYGAEVEGEPRMIVLRFWPREDTDRFLLLGQTIERLNDEITRRKQAFAELEAAIRIRDEFLAIASHELRTPIAALRLQLAVASRLSTKANQPAIEAAIEKSVASVDRLGRLANELLDVSALDAGRVSLARSTVDLATLVREVAARVPAPTATVHVATPDHPVEGTWDAFRIEQVVTNLVDNAVKFGRGDRIDVTVGVEDERALLVVRDRGIGIAPDALDSIFEKFQRAVSPNHYGGFGLGLWISRQIVEAHGGTIAVESRLGEGATFTVKLPSRSGASREDAAAHGRSER